MPNEGGPIGAPGEEELIQALFRGRQALPEEVRLGIGDDAAVLAERVGGDWVAAVDSVIEGIHALPGSPPEAFGWKAVAVNVSDLAAMGATPRHALLAAALPRDMPRDRAEGLATGLHEALAEWDLALVGGDTDATPGPLTLSLTLLGRLESDDPVRRSGARPGDRVYVTGTLGDAAAGLTLLSEPPEQWLPAYDWLVERHRRPRPPLAFGRSLPGFASAGIDVSDGLAADLGRIAVASGVGIELDPQALPLSAPMGEWAWASGGQARRYALAGGEDFELAFTAPTGAFEALHRAQYATDTRCSAIGRVTPERPGEVFDPGGEILTGGYDHFPASPEDR